MEPGFPDNPRFYRFSAWMFCQSNLQRWFLGSSSSNAANVKVNLGRSDAFHLLREVLGAHSRAPR
jgi:hypothetical protein